MAERDPWWKIRYQPGAKPSATTIKRQSWHYSPLRTGIVDIDRNLDAIAAALDQLSSTVSPTVAAPTPFRPGGSSTVPTPTPTPGTRRVIVSGSGTLATDTETTIAFSRASGERLALAFAAWANPAEAGSVPIAWGSGGDIETQLSTVGAGALACELLIHHGGGIATSIAYEYAVEGVTP